MMHMKKMILCLLVVILCSCQYKSSTEKKEDPLYFVFATPLYSHPIWQQAKDGMNVACDELDVACDWEGPIRISIPDMEDIINTALMKKVDGIITQGVISSTLIDRGFDYNIPFVLVDSPVQGGTPLAQISKDFDEQAEILLEDIEKKLGEDTYLTIGVQVSDLDFDLAKEQISSAQRVFERHKGGFEICAISESKSDQLHSKNEWMQVFMQGHNMNVALNFAGENAIGCVDAIDTLSITSDMLIYGVDDMDDTIKLVKDGRIDGSVVTSFYQYGYEAVHLLYDYITKGINPETTDIATNILLVNQQNVDRYQEDLKRIGS